MNSEDVIVYFTALVAIGMIVVGLLTTVLHSYQIVPIVIIGVILAIFVLLARGNFAHKIESIEKLEKINELLVGEKESEDKLSYCDLENIITEIRDIVAYK